MFWGFNYTRLLLGSLLVLHVLWIGTHLNWYFVLPCRPISASRIASFYQDNPEALGKTTHLLITIRSFERYPVKSEYLPRVELTIRWPDDKTFTWEGKVCEQQSKGKGQWPH